jgi:Lysozyme like domain
MKLEIPQLIALAAGAGFVGDDLTTAVSIALAESGGDPNAYNPERAANTPQGYGSFGLWQIYLKAHPEYKGQNLFDPQLNASAAFAVYSSAGNSFRPWSTFGNGAYLAHVDTVNGIISASQDTTASDGGPVPGDGGFLGMAIVGALALWLAMKFFG